MKVIKKAILLQLCKTTIMRFHISEMHKQGNHIAISLHSIIKFRGKILSSYKIFVEITCGKQLHNMQKYRKILLFRKK